MLIKLVASGQFIINAPYAPDEEDYDNEIFEFSEKLITESYEKAPSIADDVLDQIPFFRLLEDFMTLA